MRIKFVANILVKDAKPKTGRTTIELEYEKKLEEEKSIDEIMDNVRDTLEKHWNYKEPDLKIKKISIIA